MNNIRSIHPAAALVLALPMLFGALPSAQAQVSVGVGISLPGVDIGINLPSYPQLVRVPGYPVYYAPSASSNYFFYDGLYWVYADDGWYSSDWYNGPWALVQPAWVPLYVLRVPVRYYRRPPLYFRKWRADAPPHWGDHWGRDWESRHRGWDRWDRRNVPAAAPLPVYQRQYSGDRYPRAQEQQRALRASNYRYQPREAVSREQFRRPVAPSTAVAPAQRDARPDRGDRRRDRPTPPPREAQRPQPSEGSQARPQAPRTQAQPDRPQMERPARPPDRPQGRPERSREQAEQAPAARPQPEQARPQQPQREQQRGAQGGPGRGRDQANGGDAPHDRGRGGPPEGRGRDKDK